MGLYHHRTPKWLLGVGAILLVANFLYLFNKTPTVIKCDSHIKDIRASNIYIQHLEEERWQYYVKQLEEKTPEPVNNIIFFETSGRGNFSYRQLAAVESAAVFVPHKRLVVYVLTERQLVKTPLMVKLETAYEVNFQPITLESFTKNTILEEWYRKGTWKAGSNTMLYLSDALRYLAVYNEGGLYMDLDVIMIKRWIGCLDRNVAVREHPTSIGGQFQVFEKGHPVILDCLKQTIAENNTEEFGIIGPPLFTKMVMERLDTSNDVLILPSYTLYEITYRYSDYIKLFREEHKEHVQKRLRNSYGVHLWNKLTRNILVPKSSSCSYVDLLKNGAPHVYASFMDDSDVLHV